MLLAELAKAPGLPSGCHPREPDHQTCSCLAPLPPGLGEMTNKKSEEGLGFWPAGKDGSPLRSQRVIPSAHREGFPEEAHLE